MTELMPSRTVSVSIARPPDVVYEFIMTPERFPEWAPGFALGVRREGGGWIVETADGDVPISFVEPNTLGVADHAVTLEPGTEIVNPIRVLPNGEGSEVIFTLFHRGGVTSEEFEQDATTVQSDLLTLKQVLEHGPERGRGHAT